MNDQIVHSFSADVTTRFDEVFWFGDFNFRLSKARGEVEAILNQVMGADMSTLLQHDQLLKEMKEGKLDAKLQSCVIHAYSPFKEKYEFFVL